MQIMIYRDEVLLTARDNATWRSGLERRFYDDHDRKVDGSTPNLVSLLRPRIFVHKINTTNNDKANTINQSSLLFLKKMKIA